MSASPSYTALRVTAAGVILYDSHRRRLGAAWETAFDAFAARAEPGIYGLRGHPSGDFEITRRDRSRLYDAIPVRYLPSPVLSLQGPQTKVPPPSPWDSVRQDGFATLLTSADGEELYEGCSAALLAWDGHSLVAPPDASPRVATITEPFLLNRHPHRRAPLLKGAQWPLVLVNAVAGVVVPAGVGDDFPPAIVQQLRDELLASARRPSI